MDYAVNVGQDSATNKYALTINILLGIVTAIGATFLPDNLQNVESVLQYNIHNAKTVYSFEVQHQPIYL